MKRKIKIYVKLENGRMRTVYEGPTIEGADIRYELMNAGIAARHALLLYPEYLHLEILTPVEYDGIDAVRICDFHIGGIKLYRAYSGSYYSTRNGDWSCLIESDIKELQHQLLRFANRSRDTEEEFE